MPRRRVVAIGVIALLMVVVLAVNLGWRHWLLGLVWRLPGQDATGHFVFMGTLCATACLGFADARVGGRRLGVRGITCIVLVAVTLDELSQYWHPSRSVTLRDLMASYLGVVTAAVMVAPVVTAWRRASEEAGADRARSG